MHELTVCPTQSYIFNVFYLLVQVSHNDIKHTNSDNKYKVLYIAIAAVIDKFGSIQLCYIVKSPTKSPCIRQPPLALTSFSSCRHFREQYVSVDYGVRSVVRHFMIMLSCGHLCLLLHDACGKKNDGNLINPYQLLVHRG